MADFLVDSDTLASARFGTSELAECVAALSILLRPDPMPWHRAWRSRYIEQLRDHLAAHRVQAAIAAHAVSPTWAADFLTAPPRNDEHTSIEPHLSAIEALSDDRLRADLEHVRRPLAADLLGPGLAAHATALLRWVWQTTIKPDWPTRRRVLEADLVARTSRLARSGWAAVFDDLRDGTKWVGNNRLQYDARPYSDIDIRGRQLTFYAAHCRGGWVTWNRDQPTHYGIVYPVTGIFADQDRAGPESLRALLGPRRATVLQSAEQPISTSAIAASTNLPLSTVAAHLRVLREAGLLQRRRSGREVLYWWTAAADELSRAARTNLTARPPRPDLTTRVADPGNTVRGHFDA